MAKGTRSSGGRNLEQQRDYYEKQISNAQNFSESQLKAYENGLKRVNDLLEKQKLFQEASLTNMTEMSDSVKSLGQYIGKSNKLFETMNTLTDGMETSMDSISQAMQHDLLSGATKFKKEVFKTADAYKSLGNVIAVNVKKLSKQQITQSQYNQSVIDSYEDLEEQIDRVQASMEGLTGQSKQFAGETLKVLKESKDTLESFAKAAERSKKNLEGMGFALDTMSSTGIPAARELSDVITKMAEGGAGLTLAFAALGAALGKMAYDLGFVGNKIKTIAGYDQEIGDLTTKIDIFNDKLRLGMTGDGKGKNFVAARAINDFGNQVANMAMEFQAAAKTALFGNQLGGVGYGAAQLQMAGVSAETIATAMKDAASAMGSNVTGKFGADIAILAARTGQTSEGIASISDTFMRLDGVSKEVSLNMQEGLRTMAKQADVNLGALMEDVAAASKDALSYQIKSGPALAKAATFAQSLGTKFTDIANAGRSMVLNYKDSIKAEMSLSAMLGRRVDLSQVRALFASGDQEGALRALKAQGLDPSRMNMFQQEALKNATGGMDLNTLQKIATRTGRTGGELGQGEVGKQNQVFLSAKSSAESAKAVAQAVQAAMTEIQNRELENEYNRAKNQALIENTDGIADLTNQLKRKEAEKDAAVGLGTGTSMLIGAGITTALGLLLTRGRGMGRLLKGGGGKGFMSMFRGGGGANMIPKGNTGKYIMSNKGNMIHEFLPSGKANPNFAMAKNLGHNPIQEYNLGRNITSNKGGLIHEFLPSGKVNPRFSMAQNLGTKGVNGSGMAFAEEAALAKGFKPGAGSVVGLEEGLASSAVKGGSKLGKFAKFGGGALSVLSAGVDFADRKERGQSNFQAGLGTAGGAAGGWAGAELGASIGAFAGPVGAVIGGLLGGAVGYFGGSSIADALTGANDEVVTAEDATTVATENMTAEQIAMGVDQGTLLSDSAYGLELQQKMLEVMGLQAEILYDIAKEQHAVTEVSLDGGKVLSILNSRTNKSYGVARDIMPATVLAKRTSSK